MRKNLSAVVCGVFALISIGSVIGMYNVKSEPMSVDLMAGLVGILSILVTILIGFQIVNYFFVRDKIRDEVNKLIADNTGNIIHTIKGLTLYARENSFVMGFTCSAFDVYMESLNEVIIGGDSSSIDFIVDKVIMAINRMEENKKRYIYRDEKKNYIKTVCKLKHKEEERIMNFILNAGEISTKNEDWHKAPEN